MVLGQSYQVFGFDLLEEIDYRIQTIGNSALSDEYMSRAYSPDFSKDPFGDAMNTMVDQANQSRNAGIEYIKNVIESEGCHLSDKKINGILYYFVEEFRQDLVRDMKIEFGDYDVKKYELDRDKVVEYCLEYSECLKRKEYSAWQLLWNTCQERDNAGNCIERPRSQVKKGAAANLETNCKENFGKYYKEGKNIENNKQEVQISQMGTDKYWNETTEDSPYDIMEDMGELGKLLYFDAERPIKPVFYNIPSFSKSKKSLSEARKESLSSSNDVYSDDEGEDKEEPGRDGGKNGPKDPGNYSDDGDKNGDKSGDSPEDPTSPSNLDIENIYEDLVEGLGALRLGSDGTEFYSNLCDNREETEVEPEAKSENDSDVEDDEDRDFDELSEAEYQEIVDYMLSAVDKYSELSPEKEKEIGENVGNKDDFGSEESAEDLDARAEQVKNCWKSCEGLRIDQKASCMLKCACGEIQSPIFNPEEFPGLGPIFLIRFCTVPAVATSFSVGGKRIHSVEEGVKEIYGVVDKLSREGRLGKWTQEYEFMDSSTKQMNFADTFAFSISVEFVDIANEIQKHTEQYEEIESRSDNEIAQSNYGIMQPLDTLAGRNAYVAIDELNTARSNRGDRINPVKSDEIQAELSEKTTPLVDLLQNTDANEHTNIESQFDLWLDQQGGLWINILEYIKNLKSSATLLNSKNKCK